MARLSEKIGYGFGDMSSSMFWKVFSYYLPFFYSNVFGLSLVDAGILVLVTRIWDAVSDPMMGIVADRTQTRWGKYRPYLLWVAPLFSIAGILLFTTPDWSYGAKLIYAYVTYILMMTIYTAINVPYGAMLGVMTDDSQEKTVFSSFRMFFAYGGSFVALAAWEPLVNFFKAGGGPTSLAWQHAMMVIAAACLVLFLLTFALTRERLKTVSTVSIGKDFRSLLSNRPWWLINCQLSIINYLLCGPFPQRRRSLEHGGRGLHRSPCSSPWQEVAVHGCQCRPLGVECRLLLHPCFACRFLAHATFSSPH